MSGRTVSMSPLKRHVLMILCDVLDVPQVCFPPLKHLQALQVQLLPTLSRSGINYKWNLYFIAPSVTNLKQMFVPIYGLDLNLKSFLHIWDVYQYMHEILISSWWLYRY